MWRSLAAVICALFLTVPAGPSKALASGCTFVLGFQALHYAVPEVGECLDSEHADPAGTGNELQDTTGGLLVWTRSNNLASFTNGYRTWVQGPFGLQQRLNTERFAWETPSPWHAHKTVVFVAGYDSSSADARSTFAPLTQQLIASDGYDPGDFIIFSYNGAVVLPDGTVQARPYSGCDANRPLAESGANLSTFLTQVQAWKGGRLVVIGHSLGGLLAYNLPQWGAGLALDSVITIDAPLHGIGPQLAFASIFDGCGAGVVQDMAGLFGSSDLSQRLAAMEAKLHQMGARVATVATSNDCVYNLSLCGIPGDDETWTQLAPADWAATVTASPPNLAGIVASHMASLQDRSILAQLAQFVGPQG